MVTHAKINRSLLIGLGNVSMSSMQLFACFLGIKHSSFLVFLISSFLYAAKGYDNYEQIIMDLVDHIAM